MDDTGRPPNLYLSRLSIKEKRTTGKEGFEPPTNALEVRGSIQLSYLPLGREAENCLSFPLTVLPLNSVIIDPLAQIVNPLLLIQVL